MHGYLAPLLVATITGAGLVTGVLFAFSNFALRALADLPAADGMLAMQRVNLRILNPTFFVLFFGTPTLCIAVVCSGVLMGDMPGRLLSTLGAACYLLGPFGITVLRNVPLNNALALVPSGDAEWEWPRYRARWQRWNHVRTALGVTASILLASGLASI